MAPSIRLGVLVILSALLQAAALAAPQLVTKGDQTRVQLTRQHLDATLEAGLAHVKATQVFRYEGAQPVEAVYTFAVPQAAAMTGLTMTVNGVRMEGLLAERKRARRTYDKIVRKRRDPALLEKVADGTFRLSVFPIAPGVDTVIAIEYVERVPLTDGAYRMTLPLGGRDARGAATVANVQVRSYRDLGDVSASLATAQVIRRGPREAVVSFEQAQSRVSLPDGLLVTAQLAGGSPSFDVETYRDETGEGWFVGVYSPGTPSADALLPRDVILVLDTSGSMEGTKLAEAKRAARWFVDQGTERDRIHIVRFSSDVTAVYPELTPLTAASRAVMHDAIDAFVAQGSTALSDAIDYVSAIPRDRGRSRSIVLLTDGRPTIGEKDPAKLIERTRTLADAGFQLATFGVGSDVDAGLLRGMAAATDGHAEVFVNVLEIEARLRRFVTRTSEPALRDMKLSAEGVTLHGLYPRSRSVAYLGEQVVISGRFTGHGDATFQLSGIGASGDIALTRAVTIPAEPSGRPSVAMQFATQKISDLERVQRLSAELTPEAFAATASHWARVERGDYSVKEELTAELIQTSLRYGVQCSYTSFLALEAGDKKRFERPSEGSTAPDPNGEEPIIEEFEISDHNEADAGPFELSEGTPDQNADSPFEANNSNQLLGIGGGAGGPYGLRFGGQRNLRARGGRGPDGTIKDALNWITQRDSAQPVASTAAMLIALLGDGHTMVRGPYKEHVKRLVRELIVSQDRATGYFQDPGADAAALPAMQQLLATLVFAELYYFDRSIVLKARADKAAAACREILTDPQQLEGLSVEALLVAMELQEICKYAHLKLDTKPLLEAELQRRIAASGTDLLLQAAALRFVESPAERDERALAITESIIATGLSVNAWIGRKSYAEGSPTGVRLWLMAAEIRAASPSAWKRLWKPLSGSIMSSQRKDAEARGAWMMGDPTRSDAAIIERTAAHTLALESPYRIAPRPR